MASPRAIEVLHCDLTDFAADGRADLITANLTGAHLVAAAPLIDACASVPGGCLILGGLQAHEETDVRRAFEALGWILHEQAEEDGWTGLLLQRRP